MNKELIRSRFRHSHLVVIALIGFVTGCHSETGSFNAAASEKAAAEKGLKPGGPTVKAPAPAKPLKRGRQRTGTGGDATVAKPCRSRPERADRTASRNGSGSRCLMCPLLLLRPFAGHPLPGGASTRRQSQSDQNPDGSPPSATFPQKCAPGPAPENSKRWEAPQAGSARVERATQDEQKRGRQPNP